MTARPFFYYKKSPFKNVQEINKMKSQEIYFINRDNERKCAAIITGIRRKKIIQKWCRTSWPHPFLPQKNFFTWKTFSKVTKIVTC